MEELSRYQPYSRDSQISACNSVGGNQVHATDKGCGHHGASSCILKLHMVDPVNNCLLQKRIIFTDNLLRMDCISGGF